MSYNTRRSGGFGGPPQQQQTVGNIGQRRPVVTNNFVSGTQLTPQNKPGGPMQATPQVRPQQGQQQQGQGQGQGQGQATNTSINFRSQQSQPQQQPQQQNQGYQTQAPAKPQTPQQPAQPVKQEPPTPTPNVVQDVTPPNPAQENANGESMDTSTEDHDHDPSQKKKPFWWRGGRKISKKEKVRRRNIKLSKILQPKNAVMILNELVKNTSYMVEELGTKLDDNQFKATVLVDGMEHTGLGRSKIQAKNSAAEVALRHFIKTNRLAEMTKDEEGNEKMDVSEDDLTQKPLPWQHVASFALFKLFVSWGDDPNHMGIANKIPGLTPTSSSAGEKQHENKPAKKMPDNPETLNPLMLLNQMLPNAQFEEIGKSGNPPNVTYSYRCNVDEQFFIGTGPNKKAAKKQAAFGACHKLLNINYPTDVYVPIY